MLEFDEQVASKAACRCLRLYADEAMAENVSPCFRVGYRKTHRAEKGLRRVHMVKPPD